MIYLILCVLSSAGIFVTFKLIKNQQIPFLPPIVVNYLTATLIGLVLNFFTSNVSFTNIQRAVPAATIIGILFIVMFFIVGLSTKHAGLTITTLASKMSLVFPIMFSIIIDPVDDITPLKTGAFVITFIAIALTVYKKPQKTARGQFEMLLPVLLFVGMGVVDSMVKFAQQYHVSSEKSAIFSTLVFFIAFLSGILVLLVKHKTLKPMFVKDHLLSGIILGTFNYGSIFFIIKALNHQTVDSLRWMDSSVIFGLNNTGIVILNTIIGYFYFKEHLLRINWIGIVLSLVVIYILFMA